MATSLSKPPMQLNPIIGQKPFPPSMSQTPNAGGPLSSLNFAEKANRPTLDPINLSAKRQPRGISSTSRSGFKSEAIGAEASTE